MSQPNYRSSLRDQYFDEPKRNLYTLALGLVVVIAAIITILVMGIKNNAVVNMAPIIVVLAIWALIMAVHVYKRKRSNPVIRLEQTRLRYFGGTIITPHLINVNYSDIEYLEKGRNVSSVRLRLKQGRRRTIPIGMLNRNERETFVEELKRRVPVEGE